MKDPPLALQDSPLASLRVDVACGPAPCDTEEGRSFLQQRMALFGRVCFLLSLLLYGFFNLFTTFYGVTTWGCWVGRWGNVLHLGIALVFLIVWLVCRRGILHYDHLSWIDTGAVLLVGLLVGLAYYLEDPGAHPEAWGVLAVTNVVLARAVIVPSSALLTTVAGVLATAPMLAGFYFGFDARDVDATSLMPAADLAAIGASPPRGLATLFMGAWGLFAAATSAVASHVIYGLQQEVREARQLGQYTLEERIGAGGMGEVYRAKHVLLRRPTAVKLMRPERTGEESLARFEREVQLTSQLTHPNTIAVYDFGRTPDGVFYYAMEYLEGITLEKLVTEDGPQRASRVIHVLMQVCGSLEEAHKAGLIHRDIKPANMILCERGGRPDTVKVVDFGLVKELQRPDSQISATNTITGTPLYLAPEAIRSPESVDARVDIYALGAVAYFMLTGSPLFKSDSFVEICSHQLHTEPVRPSVLLGRDLPRDLEGIVMRCLAKEPDQRAVSAKALLRELQSCGDAAGWSEDEASDWWVEWKANQRTESVPAVSAEMTPTQSLDNHLNV